jgi:hypothetical protein
MSTAASTGGAPASTGGASTGAAAGGGGGGSSAIYGGSPGGNMSTGGAVGGGDDWRQRMAGGSSNEKDVKQLERYESPDQVWKKARELETKLSAGELRPVLAANATVEETAAYRKAYGIPEKPEDYKITMPAGRQQPKEDDAFLKGFLTSAHKNHMTQAQVDASISTFYGEVDRLQEATSAAEEEAVQKTEDTLRQDWGADYRVNKAMAESLLSRAPAGFRDRFMNGYLDDHTPIKASPEAWKWLVQMEREINPAATVVPGAGANAGKSIADEIASLKTMMGDTQSEYWKGPNAEKNQARYRELIDAQERIAGKAKAAA